VFTSPVSPEIISNLIDTSFTYQSNSNFYAALKYLIQAKTQWLSYEKTEHLKPEAELFFEMAKGAIYESCKKDDLALGQYFSCRAISDQLNFNSPDRALVFCGLGSVMTHLGHYKLALRSYLMAKKIRERCIGGDSVEAATVYNNLGVNMYHLFRYQEAFAYFELSEAIFTMMLGPHHTRTLLVKQSIDRVKRQNILAAPSFKVLWTKQFEDPFPKRIKKKDKKKKGKK
jgi:tetratricopeptide (TPR) repeat protein